MTDLTINIGDEIGGFQLEEIDTLDDYKGKGYLFKHVRTGMQIYQVVNDDRERFFSYVFKTNPINDSGVAHIIEHSVLSGSERYPLRDPFMELAKGSANTFLNALTYPEKTLFPAASPLKKDFQHLFEVYTDAVFAPLLREETFLQEGVRLSCDENDNFTYEGVVFNEMLGDFSDSGNVVFSQLTRTLYPDSLYSYISGGDPKEIVSLNYQQFKSYYSQHYQPTNCCLFLYGDMEIGENFEFLNKEYLASRSMLQASPLKLESTQWDAPRCATIDCPKDGSNGSSVLLAFSTCESNNSLDVLSLSCLVDLLIGSTGTPLYKAMIDSGLGEDVSNLCGMSSDFYQMPFILGFSGAEPDNAKKIEDFLMTKLKDIAKNGFDPEQIKGTVKRQLFKQKEIAGGQPRGLIALRRSMRGWLNGESPSSTIQYGPVLDELVAQLEKNPRYFEDWMTEKLINNNHRLLLTAIPSEAFAEKQKKVIASKLKATTSQLSKEAILALKENTKKFEEFQKKGDDKEALETIPHLHIDDLPKDIIESTSVKTEDLSTTIYQFEEPTNGIVYVNYALHLEDLTMDELILLPLFSSVMDMAGVGDMDYIEVNTKMKNLMGSYRQVLEVGEKVDQSEVICLLGQAKILNEGVDEALDFIVQLLTQSHMDDMERIWAAIVDSKGIYASNGAYNGHRLASIAASSVFSTPTLEVENLLGVTQWRFLSSLNKSDMKRISQNLIALQHKIINRDRLEIHITCDKENMESNVKKLHTFIESFPVFEREKSIEKNYPEVMNRKVTSVKSYTLPSDVSYTSMVIKGAGLDSEENAAQRVLASLMTGNELWQIVRGQGGAYGVDCYVENLERLVVFTSYRDPQIASTFETFKKVLEKYSTTYSESKLIEDAVISNVSNDLRPYGPAQKSLIDFRRILYGITNDIRRSSRKAILSITTGDVKDAAKHLLEEKDVSYAVVTGPQKLEEEKQKMPLLDVQPCELPL